MSRKRLKKTMALALEDLEPALWGTLAPGLLNLVFVRLPVAQISQLRLLSKLWRASIDSFESDFSQLLEDKVYPNLFGFRGTKKWKWGPWGVPCLWMFDVNEGRWCSREIARSVYGSYVDAADGGLVCVVSDSKKDPLTIVVMNPLTDKRVELPRLLCIHDMLPTIQPSMLQLKMNRKTNQYKVFFVCYLQSGNRGLLVQVYDSRTKEWSIVGPREKSWGRISGYLYFRENHGDYDSDYDGERQDPCVYDFAQGQLLRYGVYKMLRGRLTISSVMLGDRIFVLHRHDEKLGRLSNSIPKGTKDRYFISEFHLQQSGVVQVKGGTHGCEPLDDYPEAIYFFELHACNGYLMVIADPSGPYSKPCLVREHPHMWLFNLSTHKWHVLPTAPGLEYQKFSGEFMCELRWSATP